MQIEEYLLVCLMFSIVFAIHSIIDARADIHAAQLECKADWSPQRPMDLLNVKIGTLRRCRDIA